MVLVVLINIVSHQYFFRIDLTEEGRYSIKEPTKEMLRQLDDVVYIEVFLEGQLNAGFKRLRRNIEETLEEFRIYGGGNIQYVFNDPTVAMSPQAKGEFMQMLVERGIQPTNIIDSREGQRTERLIFPGAIISYGGAERGVMLLRGNQALSAEEKLNQSIENIEYELASAIQALTRIEQQSIGIVRGHGEIDPVELSGLTTALQSKYIVQNTDLQQVPEYDALIIAKPSAPFKESEKYVLDQYIMRGGNVLFLIDKLHARMDSAVNEHNYAFPYDLNLDDQLFKYGVRVNNDLVQDNSSGVYPIVVGNMGDQPQVNLLPWPFFPLINRFASHPITRNLNGVITRFVSTVDTVSTANSIQKTPLMKTSAYSRSVTAPVKVSIQDLRKNLKPEMLNEPNLVVAWLLEGNFTSLYKNRFKPEGINEKNFLAESIKPSKLVVIGDGDLARNEVNPRTGEPQPLGYDPFLNETFANEELLMNALAYMLDEDGLILARNKEIKIRPLNKVKVNRESTMWQVINLAGPVCIVILFGLIRFYLRKRKYSR